jgi:hypothetical protein
MSCYKCGREIGEMFKLGPLVFKTDKTTGDVIGYTHEDVCESCLGLKGNDDDDDTG